MMKPLFFSIFTTMMIFSSIPLMAADKKEEKPQQVAEAEKVDKLAEEKSSEKTAEKPIGYYAPDFCDFEITFPEKPISTKRCPQNIAKCYQIVNYTYVYDLSTTVEVSANCVPSTPASYKKYSESVMKAALTGMAQRVGLSSFNIDSREKENAGAPIRQSSLIGTGSYGRQSRIYNAQLWIGQNSIMTIEAKLTGKTHAQADAAFGNILSSLAIKDVPSKD
jgi:hypothetical protein